MLGLLLSPHIGIITLLYSIINEVPQIDIVDIVDTGNTLKANGLEARELIEHISSRLVVNRASMKMKHERINPIIEKMSAAVDKRRT